MINRRLFLASLAALGMPAMNVRTLFAREVPSGGPADILIVRHGEEPQHGAHLNERGRARAAALVTLFPARFAVPTVLFATRPTPESARPTETLAPLSVALHLPVDDRFADRQTRKLADAVLNDPANAHGHVLICWHHGTMANLAADLGVIGPPEWPASRYDHVWHISFVAGRATLKDEPQRLLPGDDERSPGDSHQPSRSQSRRKS